MRPRDQWHASHEFAKPPKRSRRTRESIAARNRAWPVIAAALGLPPRLMRADGSYAEGNV